MTFLPGITETQAAWIIGYTALCMIGTACAVIYAIVISFRRRHRSDTAPTRDRQAVDRNRMRQELPPHSSALSRRMRPGMHQSPKQ